MVTMMIYSNLNEIEGPTSGSMMHQKWGKIRFLFFGRNYWFGSRLNISRM